MTSSNANKKYISLNNLGSKHILFMKFGQFLSHYKRKNFFKKFLKFLKQATYISSVIAKLSKFV